jgi:hypothetical protein
MRHFHRTHISPADVVSAADAFFPSIGLIQTFAAPRERRFSGESGNLTLRVRPEGGHYTLIEVETDQVGESRLDRNAKRFFVTIHRRAEPAHKIQAAY